MLNRYLNNLLALKLNNIVYIFKFDNTSVYPINNSVKWIILNVRFDNFNKMCKQDDTCIDILKHNSKNKYNIFYLPNLY